MLLKASCSVSLITGSKWGSFSSSYHNKLSVFQLHTTYTMAIQDGIDGAFWDLAGILRTNESTHASNSIERLGHSCR